MNSIRMKSPYIKIDNNLVKDIVVYNNKHYSSFLKRLKIAACEDFSPQAALLLLQITLLVPVC